MKIETITQTIEFTIEEKHSITVCRKRTTVFRADDRAEAGCVSEIEDRAAEAPTITTEQDSSRKHN